jgi:CheY-like chemotaxis protein
LLIVNLKPFFDSALANDLTPFEEFKTRLQQELKDRYDDNKDVLIIADCADNLFSNKYFDQCNLVEKWWQDTYMKWQLEQQKRKEQNHFNVICPYSGSLLSKHPFDQHKHEISHNHSITIDTSGRILTDYTRANKGKIQDAGLLAASSPPKELPVRALVVEPEPDLQQMYSIWLRLMGFKEVVFADSAKKCLDEIIKITDVGKNKNNTKEFDMIILDTYLRDIPCIQVAKEIFNRKPDQRIIFTTTLPYDTVRQYIESIGIKNNDHNNEILIKPFEFSRLCSLIGRSIKNQQQGLIS